MATIEALHQEWMKDPEYRQAHKDLATWYERARTVIQARVQAHPAESRPQDPARPVRRRTRRS